MTGGRRGEGGSWQRFIIYTQKNHNFRFCVPKKITSFLAYPKNPLIHFLQPKKIPRCFFFTTQKNPGDFHRPKKITRTPPPPHQNMRVADCMVASGFVWQILGAPLTYFNDGWGPKDFLGLWKTLGVFWVTKNKTQGWFWVLYFSSAQVNNNIL